MKNPNFPKHFHFGTSTSSYQIEGNYDGTGAGKSIWTTFCQQENAILNGEDGEIACDHYRRWQEDIKLMQELGIHSYRFSLSWPRIIPEGTGAINQEGLDFYDKLVGGLLEAGITPFPTLYHWDLPQALQDKGGWASSDISDAFAAYTETIVKTLGDRVSNIFTLNEPWVFLHLGHVSGVHAPGYKDPEFAAKVYKNILITHGKAMQTIKSINPDIKAGHCCNFEDYQPKTNSEEDRKAAELYFDYQNMIFSDPWEKGRFTPAAEKAFGVTEESFTDEELKIITTPNDLMGFNYYTKYLVSHDPTQYLNCRTETPGGPVTDMNWVINPNGLSKLLEWAYNRYKQPIYVTENGCAYDYPVENGRVRDKKRIDYLEKHLNACEETLEKGVDLRAYHVWSFLDNFEWALGYSKRFGIVHVDFETQQRIIKNSGYFYRDFIRNHEVSLEEQISEN